ncbi:hypothetical protein K491DRAFT_698170 [Lophiostoma macrostomum CBS 122681]|uniref:DUF3074 domain-containing protein n=1 Tax=Lophiostoma macrostomum CBS 122681 TaxID=1314788 RepID=A0A6A6SRZ9_9PLEO|nr:hypothetical protein K491DRAFT_698170 [Lophiostoma macrostomum CBS 122681]
MTELQKALECLRPKDFGEVPLDGLSDFLSDLFNNAELIANSVPPPPNGSPYESSQRSRSDANGATSAADLTVSKARRPAPATQQAELQKAWGKPLKLSAKDNETGISVFKMAGHDRHGAWFARTSVHEGLGFTKWKRAMMQEFPESLAVQGGPGEGNVRGIGGDKRLEDIDVDGVGKLQVYQLSAQFPGPTAPREFITLLVTSENALTDASKIGNSVPRHYIVVSIPVTHPDAPPRNGMVRGQYESVEMIREIPLSSGKSASTSDLLKHTRSKSRDRSSTVGFAESRGPDAKGERIDKFENADSDDPETNPVEWIMITRSDPGGGIPRFMVERSTPSSIVQDAGKFLNWACSKNDFPSYEDDEETAVDESKKSWESERTFAVSESNGILAGVGSSIADNPRPHSFRRPSHIRDTSDGSEDPSIIQSMAAAVEPYIPDPALNSLQRTDSRSSTTTSSSIDSFASAEQFNTAPEGPPVSSSTPLDAQTSRELERIEQKKKQLQDNLIAAREKQGKEMEDASTKTAKELEKATERHNRERKKQEDKFAKEVQKLEARRERETKKVLAKQQKEADKNLLLKTQRERDEWKDKAGLAETENRLLKEQIGELQRENTVLVAKMGKSEGGLEVLRKVREELEGKGRTRASSRASAESGRSKGSGSGSGKGGAGKREREGLGERSSTFHG